MATDAGVTGTDPWGVADLDLDAYLERIGLASHDRPPGPPSPVLLGRVVAAHVAAIPFENVDVVLGRPVSLDLAAITDKVVRRGRGGYCYEHVLLAGAALERLGFGVSRLACRVQPHRGGPATHASLLVSVDGLEYLVDVGYGGEMTAPMPLVAGLVVDQQGWDHRLEHDPDRDWWTLTRRERHGWEPQHRFDRHPAHPADYRVLHHYTSTSPHSPFTGRLIVLRAARGVSRRLVGDELTVEEVDGPVDTRRVGRGNLIETLEGLGVHVDGAAAEELRRWWDSRPAPP